MMFGRSAFRSQLVLTFLGFVLLAEVVVAGAILHQTYGQAVAQARSSLEVGTRVLDKLMTLRSTQLLSIVEVLSSDFGFKSAVATKDGPTLRTVLANFGDRAHADLAIIAERDGRLTAAVPALDSPDADHPFQELLNTARKQGDAAGMIVLGRRAYQFVVLPVRAPRLIAWVGMGFEVNHELAERLASLTGVSVDFEVSENGRQIFHTAAKRRGPTSAAPNTATQAQEPAFLSARHVMLKSGPIEFDALLSLNRSAVLSPYYVLARNLAGIFALSLLLSALIAIWLARRLSQPLQELSHFAQAIGAGTYREPPRSRAITELDLLGDTLDRMQRSVREREARISHQATHDAMTGLLNREAIRERLAELIDEGQPLAVLRVAVHGFARINAALGYRLGDQVLRTVAERLGQACRPQDAIGRVEGNDFLLLLPYDRGSANIEERAARLRADTEKPLALLQTPIALLLEVGVVHVPEQAKDLDSVWRRSVIARERSREARGQTFVYQEGLDEARRRELLIVQDLASAIERDELRLVYQPIMSMGDHSVRQVEALARWVHPTLGSISPDEFIRLAEHSGQIRTLTDWVVKRAAAQLREWQADGLALGVAINLSGDELAEPGLDEAVAPLIDAAGPGQAVTLEVTESALLRNPEGALDNLRRMQARGALIAIDDFGTGYSSLAQLKQIAANKLKIDKSFVLKLDTTPVDQFIVNMIIDLGHKLGMEIVAEGVENDSTIDYLTRQGAEFMQGYVLARPLPAEELRAWLDHHARHFTAARKIGHISS